MISRDQIQTAVVRESDGAIRVIATLEITQSVITEAEPPDPLFATESARNQAQNLVLSELYGGLREPVDAIYQSVRQAMTKHGCWLSERQVHDQFQALANLINFRVMTVSEIKKNETQERKT